MVQEHIWRICQEIIPGIYTHICVYIYKYICIYLIWYLTNYGTKVVRKHIQGYSFRKDIWDFIYFGHLQSVISFRLSNSGEMAHSPSAMASCNFWNTWSVIGLERLASVLWEYESLSKHNLNIWCGHTMSRWNKKRFEQTMLAYGVQLQHIYE